jgi:hypothetical protein
MAKAKKKENTEGPTVAARNFRELSGNCGNWTLTDGIRENCTCKVPFELTSSKPGAVEPGDQHRGQRQFGLSSVITAYYSVKCNKNRCLINPELINPAFFGLY